MPIRFDFDSHPIVPACPDGEGPKPLIIYDLQVQETAPR